MNLPRCTGGPGFQEIPELGMTYLWSGSVKSEVLGATGLSSSGSSSAKEARRTRENTCLNQVDSSGLHPFSRSWPFGLSSALSRF